jgi:hypothetical protein
MGVASVGRETGTCEGCGRDYLKNRITQQYCTKACRMKIWGENNRPASTNGVSSSTTGAIHELMVCVDLMRRGYMVFRSMSPNCKCDLIAMDTVETYRLEVTTGYRGMDGKLIYIKKPADYLYDSLVLVEADGRITYQPELPKVAP